MKPIKIFTAFSGGLAAPEFALKYENIPFIVHGAVEIDKYARKQYLQFHGEPQTFYEDISDLDARKYKGEIDLFVWGSPCQDLSLAGKRKGFDGEKSSLFRQGARVQKEMMPKVFVFENVKGLLSSNNGDDYKEVVKTFQDMGYLIASKVLNAKEHGTAQNRERVFIVGFLDENEYHRFRFEEPQPLTKVLKDYLEDEIDEKYYLSEKMVDGFVLTDSESKLGFINQDTQASSVFGVNVVSPALCSGTHGYAQGYVKIERWVNKTVGSVLDDVCPTLRASSGTDIRKMPRLWIKEPIIYQIGRGYNNGGLKSICPTLTINSWEHNNHLIEPIVTKWSKHPFRIRRFTPRECFRLDGVEDEDIVLVNSDTQCYKIAGNAIEVNTFRSIVRAIFKNDVKEPVDLFDFL